MNDIEELLLRHGIKPTPQRAVIASYLVNTMSHPTAEDVFLQVADKLPVPLSRATVYNTLNVFVSQGLIKEVFTEPGKARYDANVSEHHHFVDIASGEVHDVDLKALKNLPVELSKEFLDGDFEVQNYQITFYGKRKR